MSPSFDAFAQWTLLAVDVCQSENCQSWWGPVGTTDLYAFRLKGAQMQGPES